jgi:hypothetical protein
MYTLVINHMQGRTFPTVEPIIPQVVREIRRAIALAGAIVVVELDPQDSLGSTDERIMSVLIKEALGRFESIPVGWRDESANLVKLAIQDNEWPVNSVRVTGVNTDSCVFSLVLGLSCLGFPRIEVIQDACNCRTSEDDDPWERYAELPGVVLLQTG